MLDKLSQCHPMNEKSQGNKESSLVRERGREREHFKIHERGTRRSSGIEEAAVFVNFLISGIKYLTGSNLRVMIRGDAVHLSEEDMAAGGSFLAGKWQTSFPDLSGTGSRERVTLKLSWVSPFPLFIYFGILTYG